MRAGRKEPNGHKGDKLWSTHLVLGVGSYLHVLRSPWAPEMLHLHEVDPIHKHPGKGREPRGACRSRLIKNANESQSSRLAEVQILQAGCAPPAQGGLGWSVLCLDLQHGQRKGG